MHAEGTQRQHYNRIATDYEAQYGDPDGVTYREEFLYRPLFVDFDLWGMLANFLFSGHYRIPSVLPKLRGWNTRLSHLSPAEFMK